MTLAAHKFEGPRAIGALYVRHGTHILAQQHGGSQERYRRAGTENVAGAVGMAVALRAGRAERPTTVERARAAARPARDAVSAVDGVELTGHPRSACRATLSVIVRDTDGDAVALALDLEGIACSTARACTTGSTEVATF